MMQAPGVCVLGKLFLFSLMPGAYPRVEHVTDALLLFAPALLATVRLPWKGLPGTNTQAY
jgi:hypothetical protein